MNKKKQYEKELEDYRMYLWAYYTRVGTRNNLHADTFLHKYFMKKKELQKKYGISK